MSYNKSPFDFTPNKHVNKSNFNLSHEWKSMLAFGYIIPCMLLETLPNDEFDIESEFFFRFQPMYFPLMHQMTMRCDYFYIPNRILWPDLGPDNQGWKKFITMESDDSHPTINPKMDVDDGVTTLNMMVLSFMGLPLIGSGGGRSTQITNINANPLSAYLKVWDEYYRVPQLEDERWFPLQPGDNSSNFDTAFVGSSANMWRCFPAKWEKDYFTSALPLPQIGEAVQIPVVGEDGENVGGNPTRWVDENGNPVSLSENLVTQGGDGKTITASTVTPVGLEMEATIRQLRLAETLQSFYERIMKVGQRYRDFIKGLWGYDPEPMNVDVPVLFGSSFGRVQIADVMTQANTQLDQLHQTGDYTGQANLYSKKNETHRYTCKEHGWILACIQLNPNTSYGQGIERLWRRSIPTDYPLDMFSSIGDQEILKEELQYNAFTADHSSPNRNEETYGYIDRFAEMKQKYNMHVGVFSDINNQYVSMHAGRLFPISSGNTYSTEFEVGSSIVSSSDENLGGFRTPDLFRILPIGDETTPVPAEATIYAHIFHSVYVKRSLPYYSIPDLT